MANIITNAEALVAIQAAGGTITTPGQAWLTQAQPWIEQGIESILRWKVLQATYTEYLPGTVFRGSGFGDVDPLLFGWDVIAGTAQAQRYGSRAGSFLALSNVPVRSITSVYENVAAFETAGGSWPAETLLAANAYYLDSSDMNYCWSGQLIRRNGSLWSSVPRTIKITYSGGISAVELEASFGGLKLAFLQAIQENYITNMIRARAGDDQGVIASTSMEDFSVSFADPMAYAGVDPKRFLSRSVLEKLSKYINVAKLIG